MRSHSRLALAAPRLALFLGWLLLATGCVTLTTGDNRQIRERIELIREAMLAKNVDGLFRYSTPDWTVSSGGEKAYGRAAFHDQVTDFLENTEIESIDTKITYLEVREDRAEVELKQTMVCMQPDDTDRRERWRFSHVESQEWVKTVDGWLVSRVQVYSMQSENLPVP